MEEKAGEEAVASAAFSIQSARRGLRAWRNANGMGIHWKRTQIKRTAKTIGHFLETKTKDPASFQTTAGAPNIKTAATQLQSQGLAPPIKSGSAIAGKPIMNRRTENENRWDAIKMGFFSDISIFVRPNSLDEERYGVKSTDRSAHTACNATTGRVCSHALH